MALEGALQFWIVIKMTSRFHDLFYGKKNIFDAYFYSSLLRMKMTVAAQGVCFNPLCFHRRTLV